MKSGSKKPRFFSKNTCERKIGYTRKSAAERVVRGMWETYHREGDESDLSLHELRCLHTYECPRCSKFHIGRDTTYHYGVTGPK